MYDQNQQQQQAGFGFDVNQYEPAAVFENIPPAFYNALIEDAEIKPSKSGQMCAITLTVFGGPFNGRKVFDNLNIINESSQAQDIARRTLRTIQDSLGKQSLAGPWDLKGGYVCIKVGISKPQEGYEQRNEVKGYKPFDNNLHQQNQQQPQQAQGYNVTVQPNGPAMGNGAPNFAPQMQQQQPPQFAQQSTPQNMPPQNMQQQAPQFNPNQSQPGMQQAQPQQQFQPQQAQPQQMAQPQQNFAPQQDNGQGSQQAQPPMQQGQAQNAPAVTGQDGQQYQQQAAPNAQPQNAQPQTFAPQNGAMPNAQPPGPGQQMPGQQMAQPSPQFQPGNAQPPQGQPAPTGNAPPPGFGQ